MYISNILILGHPFVRRLNDHLVACVDALAVPNFHLPESGDVFLLDTGGRTDEKLNKYDFSSLHNHSPDIVILAIGTNDFSPNDFFAISI